MDEIEQYPEHVRLAAVQDRSQAAHDFLEWAGERGYALVSDGGYHPADLRALLAEWLGIDLRKISDEKQAMYEAMRDHAEQDAGQ